MAFEKATKTTNVELLLDLLGDELRKSLKKLESGMLDCYIKKATILDHDNVWGIIIDEAKNTINEDNVDELNDSLHSFINSKKKYISEFSYEPNDDLIITINKIIKENDTVSVTFRIDVIKEEANDKIIGLDIERIINYKYNVVLTVNRPIGNKVEAETKLILENILDHIDEVYELEDNISDYALVTLKNRLLSALANLKYGYRNAFQTLKQTKIFKRSVSFEDSFIHESNTATIKLTTSHFEFIFTITKINNDEFITIRLINIKSDFELFSINIV